MRGSGCCELLLLVSVLGGRKVLRIVEGTGMVEDGGCTHGLMSDRIPQIKVPHNPKRYLIGRKKSIPLIRNYGYDIASGDNSSTLLLFLSSFIKLPF
jgi:hypothetical protein